MGSNWRRLRYEPLERRDLLTVMRLVAWNTLNGPNDAAADADFATILQAIGNETVEGNTKPLDILALQETDLPGSGFDSIGRIEAILDDLYPSTDYASIASGLDGGGDATGFVYDTATVSLLGSAELPALSFTHTILRGDFRPAGTSGESDFYVYSVHLKSGTSLVDATRRGEEAALLRADIDALGEGAAVLMVGDFNMQGSSETAWSEFIAAGPGQLQDVANAPGEWKDNPAFLHLHTQDPMGTMDDRFDLQFATGEFFDGVGIEYVDNSYRVFGNNGTHSLNGSITTGTGASPAVLSALASASDHLPIVADYELVLSTPNVRVRETANATKAIEGGAFDTYSLVLDTVPTSNVTVTVTPDTQVDVGNGPGVARDFLFTPANALTPQFVVVAAVDDQVAEGNHAGSISHTSASADLEYNNLAIDDVVVMLVDNDAPTIYINELDADTAGIDTLEFVELYDGGVGNASLAGLTLVLFNGATDLSYEVFDLAGYFTDAEGFFVAGNQDVPGVDLVFNGNTLQNGADAVALYAGPFSDNTPLSTTNLLDAVVYGTGQADDAILLGLLQPAQPQVNENANGNKDFDAIARVPDGGMLRSTDTFVAQSPTPGTRNQPDFAGIVITQSASRVDVAEGGGADSYQIAMATFPTSDVTITVTPDSQLDLGAGPGMAIVLTFMPTNAIIPQTVFVEAVDDSAVEGPHTGTITHAVVTSDLAYAGVAAPVVVANIEDNEVVAQPLIVISEIMYDPASDESEPGLAEWIEVVNIGGASVDLGGWLLDDEDSSNWGPIPAATLLAPGQAAVLFDEEFTTEALFRSAWNVPADALLVGIAWGSLANSPSSESEILELRDSGGNLVDLVNYDDTAPWPTNSNGPSIYLVDLASDNNDGANWVSSNVGIANASAPTGLTFSADDIGSPGRLPGLPGDYNNDAVVNLADYTLWRDAVGGSSLPANEVVTLGVVDTADYAVWKAAFGKSSTATLSSLEASFAPITSVATIDSANYRLMLPIPVDGASRLRPSAPLNVAWHSSQLAVYQAPELDWLVAEEIGHEPRESAVEPLDAGRSVLQNHHIALDDAFSEFGVV